MRAYLTLILEKNGNEARSSGRASEDRSHRPHARAPFMAAASRGVGCPFVCVQATAVPRPISRVLVTPIRVQEDRATASATATVELGFRRERTATNRQDEAQNATGESIFLALSLSLSPSLCPSLLLASSSFWLSSPQSRKTFRLVTSFATCPLKISRLRFES